jgi:hypothetical protein
VRPAKAHSQAVDRFDPVQAPANGLKRKAEKSYGGSYLHILFHTLMVDSLKNYFHRNDFGDQINTARRKL